MRVIVFGATGMVGQGVLRECLLDPSVETIITVGRAPTGQRHDKLREIIHSDFLDFSPIESDLSALDTCFFCLGISSAGMSEEDYHRVTYDFTLAAAETLARRNPGMTFVYVSGAGTDSSGRGNTMWARVKGKTENALLRLPLNAFMFRPGIIQPLHGIRSKTRVYQVFYSLARPLLPLLRRWFPGHLTTTEELGKAMLAVANGWSEKRVLETVDIHALGTERNAAERDEA